MKPHLLRRSAAAVLTVVAISAMVLHGSQQALSPAAGLSNDAPSQAMTVDPAPLTQGDTVTACITVTSAVAGSADARLRASVLSGSGPADGVIVRVETVESPAPSCATATVGEVVFHGPLADRPEALTRRHDDRSTALPAAWSPDQAGAQRAYRVTLLLDDVADATAVMTPSVRFVWDVVRR